MSIDTATAAASGASATERFHADKSPYAAVKDVPAERVDTLARLRDVADTALERAARRLQDEFPELRKRYWGQHLWARGYFCATVGSVDEATIREYIENQKWDQDDQGFKITAPTEP